MKTVSFPGLGLHFTLDPIAFSVFGWPIHWYGIIIALGFLLALFFCMRQVRHFGLEQDDLLDMLLFAVPASIVGARLYYVIFNLDRFRDAEGNLMFSQLWRIQDGGGAIYGSILAAVLAVYLVMRYKKLPFLAMADLGAMGLLIGQSVGRWGNFVNVEAYGGETSLPWRMEIMEYANGSWQTVQVHPTFLYESLWNLLGLLLLFFLLKRGLRSFDGMLFFTYIAWYGFGRGLIEGLRTDSLMLFDTGIRVSQMLGFLSAGLAVLYLLYRLRRHPDPAERLVDRVTQHREEPNSGSDT